MRGDAGVGADEAAVASTSLAVGAVRVAARTAPRADALPAMNCQRTGHKGLTLEGEVGLTSTWSLTLKLAVWPESSFLPNLTEGSTWPLEALPTAGQTAIHRDERRRRQNDCVHVHDMERRTEFAFVHELNRKGRCGSSVAKEGEESKGFHDWI